jgi:hypothetical protein
MTCRDKWLRATALAAIVGAGFTLQGCESIRQATGAVKQAPDEFTVLTKAPLVIPPDYNLRPPQPGVASRNEVDPDQQAQAALFAPSPADQAAALDSSYSDGEKLLLAKSSALGTDPNIRRTVNADAGEDDQGPAFASKVLFEGAMPPPPRAVAAAAPVAAPPVETEGWFGRNFGFLGLGSDGAAATQVQQPVIAQPQVVAPVPQMVAQAPQIAQPVLVPAPQIAAAPQPVQQPVLPAPQIVQAPQVVPQVVQAPQAVTGGPQVVYAQPQAAPAYAAPQVSAPVEQPGWFTRNFIMSPQQRAALAAGQPIPPSVTQQIEIQRQQQQLAQPQIVQAAPQPQVAAAPGQFVAPQVVVAQPQAVLRPTVQAQAVGPKPEPKNLYQYFFGVPQAQAATVTPVSQPVAAQQPIVVQVPQTQVQPLPQPAPPPVQSQPVQQQQDSGWFSWLPF